MHKVRLILEQKLKLAPLRYPPCTRCKKSFMLQQSLQTECAIIDRRWAERRHAYFEKNPPDKSWPIRTLTRITIDSWTRFSVVVFSITSNDAGGTILRMATSPILLVVDTVTQKINRPAVTSTPSWAPTYMPQSELGVSWHTAHSRGRDTSVWSVIGECHIDGQHSHTMAMLTTLECFSGLLSRYFSLWEKKLRSVWISKVGSIFEFHEICILRTKPIFSRTWQLTWTRIRA